MKVKHFFLMSLLSVVLLGACSSSDELLSDVFGENEELIEQAKKEPISDVNQLPDWIRTIVLSAHNGFAVNVYAFEYKGTTYIYVEDMADSCWTCGRRIFTTKGVEITPPDDWTDRTGLYYELDGVDNKTKIFSSFKNYQ